MAHLDTLEESGLFPASARKRNDQAHEPNDVGQLGQAEPEPRQDERL